MESDIEEYQEKYKYLNDNLVVSSYRKFCKDLNLPLHFWEEISDEYYNSEISLEETKNFNPEAMDLFNIIKPDVVFFEGKVIRYQFTSWTEFTFADYPVGEYLEETSDNLFYLKKLEEHYENIADNISVIITILVLITLFSINHYLPLSSQLGGSIYFTLTIIISALSGTYLRKYLKDTKKGLPKRIIDDGRLEEKNVKERVNKLRSELKELHKEKGADKFVEEHSYEEKFKNTEEMVKQIRFNQYRFAENQSSDYFEDFR
ncbi:MAG: hypothetical protein ACOCRX_09395 [Candidatus Woesearchaeota archaeon]